MGNWCTAEEQYKNEPRKSIRIEVQRYGEGKGYQTNMMSESDAIERIHGDLYSEVDLYNDGRILYLNLHNFIWT
jgi:hypothetical protein